MYASLMYKIVPALFLLLRRFSCRWRSVSPDIALRLLKRLPAGARRQFLKSRDARALHNAACKVVPVHHLCFIGGSKLVHLVYHRAMQEPCKGACRQKFHDAMSRFFLLQ